MRHSKLGLKALGVAVLGALSVMAVFAAGAQGQGTAGKFLIDGSSANLKASFRGDSEVLFVQLLVPVGGELGFNIKCKLITIANGFVNNNEDTSFEITFQGCLVYKDVGDSLLEKCTVHSTGATNGTIKASALVLPRLHNGGPYVLVEPPVSNFTTIEILGELCFHEGVYPIKGSATAEILNTHVELVDKTKHDFLTNNRVKPLLLFSEVIQKLVGDKLQIGAIEVFISGSATVELTSLHAGRTLGVH